MSCSPRVPSRAEIDRRAAEWIARYDAGLSGAELMEFEQWRGADSRHRDALARFEFVWSAVGRPRRTGNSAALSRELDVLTRNRRRRRQSVAGGVLATVVLAALTWWTDRAPPAESGETIQAVLQGPHSQTLPDGSVIEFPEGAEFTIDFRESVRRVMLARGEAHFAVMKDPARPFIVDAGAIEVRAVGTAFAVQRGGEAVEVLVTSGRVAVDRFNPEAPQGSAGVPHTLATLDAGNRVVVGVQETAASAPPPPVFAVSAAELDERLAWRVPRVEFSGTPLAQVVAFLNRRNRVQFVIEDSTLAATALSGLFRADDTDAFVRVMEAAFGVKAEHRDGKIFLRTSR